VNKHLVFVYGMLRRDGVRPMSVSYPAAKFIAEATTSGHLYDLGAFPGVLLDASGSPVVGEVYEVDDELLNRLDEFEATSNYLRQRVEIHLGSERKPCWIYVPDPQFYSPRTLIASGDWIAHGRTERDRQGETATGEIES
jgi:gamma-glutamylcyclotransferase (GGCT)/AIG2-like uncharacterized protein YtfP